jgi:formylmethanofuran dehydrogenase subunit B
MTAFINGKSAPLDEALDHACQILAQAKGPLVAGLGTDMAGGRAALRLASIIGAAVDHMASGALARDIAVRSGWHYMYTTPREAKVRGDTVLTAGAEAARYAAARLNGAVKLPEPRERHIISLVTGGYAPAGSISLDADPARLPGVLAAVTAAVKGNPIASSYANIPEEHFRAAAAQLQAAKFGVAVWSADDLDELTIEALMSLVDALNANARFTALPLALGDNAYGMAELSVWTTGLPLRISFAPGRAVYDPWRYDSTRLVEAKECDAAVWISSFRPAAPPWKTQVPLIALTGPGANFVRPPEVHFNIGKPGVDHDGEYFDTDADAIIAVNATAPSARMSVAGILDNLAVRLERKAA